MATYEIETALADMEDLCRNACSPIYQSKLTEYVGNLRATLFRPAVIQSTGKYGSRPIKEQTVDLGLIPDCSSSLLFQLVSVFRFFVERVAGGAKIVPTSSAERSRGSRRRKEGGISSSSMVRGIDEGKGIGLMSISPSSPSSILKPSPSIGGSGGAVDDLADPTISDPHYDLACILKCLEMVQRLVTKLHQLQAIDAEDDTPTVRMEYLRCILQNDANARFWARSVGLTTYSIPAEALVEKLMLELQHLPSFPSLVFQTVSEFVFEKMDFNGDGIIDVVEFGIAYPKMIFLLIEDTVQLKIQRIHSENNGESGNNSSCRRCSRLHAELTLEKHKNAELQKDLKLSGDSAQLLQEFRRAKLFITDLQAQLLEQKKLNQRLMESQQMQQKNALHSYPSSSFGNAAGYSLTSVVGGGRSGRQLDDETLEAIEKFHPELLPSVINSSSTGIYDEPMDTIQPWGSSTGGGHQFSTVSTLPPPAPLSADPRFPQREASRLKRVMFDLQQQGGRYPSGR